MKHFEAEVIKQGYCQRYGHHRIQVGVFASLEKLQAKLNIKDGDLLNRCLYEIIPRARFEIKQDATALLNWTSEDADGGANRMIFNNLTGCNFTGTEYEVYLEKMREQTNLDIRPELLTLERVDCEMPELLDKAKLGWFETETEPFRFTPGILWHKSKGHLIFRYEKENHQCFFTDWNSLKLYEETGVEEAIAAKITNRNYEDLQNGRQPAKKESRTAEFDYWLAQRLAEYFEKEK